MVRPITKISSHELVSIMSFYPTLDEVASWFNCSPDTIERRVRDEWGETFKEFRVRHSGKTRLLLKRKAISKALEEDNEKMLLYCLRTLTDMDDRNLSTESEVKNELRLSYSLPSINITVDEVNL